MNAYLEVPARELKMLRETLCIAQARASETRVGRFVNAHDVTRLQLLIDEIDRHRPLGPDGKHGDLHTPTCGCKEEDK